MTSPPNHPSRYHVQALLAVVACGGIVALVAWLFASERGVHPPTRTDPRRWSGDLLPGPGKNAGPDGVESRVTIGEASLAVLVIDEDSRPVPGASVYEGDRFAGSTSDAGRLLLRMISSGSSQPMLPKELAVQHPDYMLWRGSVDPDVREVVAKLESLVGLDVRVRGEDGLVIDGALVELFEFKGALVEGNALGAFRTNAEGIARFRSLNERSVSLSVSADGYVRANHDMTLGPTQDQQYEVVLADGRSLWVRVLDARGGVHNRTQVVAELSDPGSTRFISRERGVAGPDGVVEIPGIPMTPLLAGVSVRGSMIADSYLQVYLPGGEEDERLDLEVVAGTDVLVSLLDDAGNEIEGQVLAELELIPSSSRIDRVPESDGGGRRGAPVLVNRRSGARPGEPALLERIPIGTPLRLVAEVSGGRVAVARNVVFESSVEHRYNIPVGRLNDVKIRILGAEGHLGGGRWDLIASESEREAAARVDEGLGAEPVYRCHGIVDDKGACSFRARAGDYRFRVWSPTGQGIVDEPLHIAHDEEFTLVVKSLDQIAGRLIDHGGRPLEGWIVLAAASDGSTAQAEVGPDGSYELLADAGSGVGLWGRSRQGRLPVYLGTHDSAGPKVREDVVEVRSFHVRVVDYESAEGAMGTLHFGYSHPLFGDLGSFSGPVGVEVGSAGANIEIPASCITASEGGLPLWAEVAPDRRSGVLLLEREAIVQRLELAVTNARVVEFDRGKGRRGPWSLRWRAASRGMIASGIEAIPEGEREVSVRVFIPHDVVELQIRSGPDRSMDVVLHSVVGDRFILP